jgi:hypothetical protein
MLYPNLGNIFPGNIVICTSKCRAILAGMTICVDTDIL